MTLIWQPWVGHMEQNDPEVDQPGLSSRPHLPAGEVHVQNRSSAACVHPPRQSNSTIEISSFLFTNTFTTSSRLAVSLPQAWTQASSPNFHPRALRTPAISSDAMSLVAFNLLPEL